MSDTGFEKSDRRGRLGFATAVANSFGRVVGARGFTVSVETATCVTYESERVEMRVTHSRGSYELGVAFRLKTSEKRYWHSLQDVICLDSEFWDPGRSGFQTSDPEVLPRLVQQLADLTCRFASCALRGDAGVFGRLDVQQERASLELTDSYIAGGIRERAAEAWARRDYSAYISLTTDLLELQSMGLTRAEASKRRYATEKLRS